MSYTTISDDAWSGEDDASHNAPCVLAARDNVEEIHNERFPKTGHLFAPNTVGTTPTGYPRLCSAPRPAPWGPFVVRVPEPAATLTVRLRIVRVDNQNVHLHATTAAPGGQVPDPPPVSDWLELSTTASPQTQAITGVPIAGGGAGIVEVYIWVHSVIDSSAEDTGSFGASPTVLWGGLVLNGISTEPSTNPPERVVRIRHQLQTSNVYDEGEAHQMMYYNPDDDIAYLWPPLFATSVATGYLDQWATHKLGVAEISGVSFEINPGAFPGPSPELFYNSEPDLAEAPLVETLEGMVALRTPQWACCQSYRDPDNTSIGGGVRLRIDLDGAPPGRRSQ